MEAQTVKYKVGRNALKRINCKKRFVLYESAMDAYIATSGSLT